MLTTGFALIVLVCTSDSYCYESIPSVWDTQEECLTKGIPSNPSFSADEGELVESITFQCVYMEGS